MTPVHTVNKTSNSANSTLLSILRVWLIYSCLCLYTKPCVHCSGPTHLLVSAAHSPGQAAAVYCSPWHLGSPISLPLLPPRPQLSLRGDRGTPLMLSRHHQSTQSCLWVVTNTQHYVHCISNNNYIFIMYTCTCTYICTCILCIHVHVHFTHV